MTPRYRAKRDRVGEWSVLDTHTGQLVANGLSQDDAQEGADNRNTAWVREIESRGGAA